MSILKELVPGSKRIGVLFNPLDPVTVPQIRDTGRDAPLLGIEVRRFPVKVASDLPVTFAQMLAWYADAALWLSGQSTGFQPGAASWRPDTGCRSWSSSEVTWRPAD